MQESVTTGCWVDLYACACFEGKLRRLFGPARFTAPSKGSMIVGPGAKLVQSDAKGKVGVGPKQIVADLADPRWRGKLLAMELQASGG